MHPDDTQRGDKAGGIESRDPRCVAFRVRKDHWISLEMHAVPRWCKSSCKTGGEKRFRGNIPLKPSPPRLLKNPLTFTQSLDGTLTYCINALKQKYLVGTYEVRRRFLTLGYPTTLHFRARRARFGKNEYAAQESKPSFNGMALGTASLQLGSSGVIS